MRYRDAGKLPEHIDPGFRSQMCKPLQAEDSVPGQRNPQGRVISTRISSHFGTPDQLTHTYIPDPESCTIQTRSIVSVVCYHFMTIKALQAELFTYLLS